VLAATLDLSFFSGGLFADAGFELVAEAAAGPTHGGMELVLSEGPSGRKVLGARQLAKYYKQKYRPQETRQGVIVNTMLAR
jgi:hypothetical protein